MSFAATITDPLSTLTVPLWESLEWDTAHDAYKAAETHVRGVAPDDRIIHIGAGSYEIWGDIGGTPTHVGTLVIAPDTDELREHPSDWLARMLDMHPPRQSWWRRILPRLRANWTERPDIAQCGNLGVYCRADGNVWIPEEKPYAATGWFGRFTRSDWTEHLHTAAAQVHALDATVEVLQAHRSRPTRG